MPDIHHTLSIAAPPEAVWPFLTKNAGVSCWWTLGETVLGGDVSKPGDFSFRSRAVTTDLTVAELAPHRAVLWRVTQSNAPGGWEGTVITFKLEPTASGTILTFRHCGFAEDNEGYRKVTAGWAHYLGNLKTVAEGGQVSV